MTYRINTAELKATEWKYDNRRKVYYSVVEELENGKWEGYVITRKA